MRKTVLVMMGLACASLAAWWSGQHPGDAALLRNFHAHHTTLDTLVTMLREDAALKRVGTDFTHPRDAQAIGVGPERLQVYRTLCRTAHIGQCVSAYDKTKSFDFLASTQGLAISGSSKGYSYIVDPTTFFQQGPDASRPGEPGVITFTADETDSVQNNGRSFTAYRHIADHWFIFYEFED